MAAIVDASSEQAQESAVRAQQRITLLNAATAQKARDEQWYLSIFKLIQKIVAMVVAKIGGLVRRRGVAGGVGAPGALDEPAAPTAPAPLDSGSDLSNLEQPAPENPENEDPSADMERFNALADAGNKDSSEQDQGGPEVVLNQPVNEGDPITVTVTGFPEEILAIKKALMDQIQPLLDSPYVMFEKKMSTPKFLLTAETIAAESERLRFAYRTISREIARLALDAIAENPRSYDGLSPMALVESLKMHRTSPAQKARIVAGSYESRILQQIELQNSVGNSYEEYVVNALNLLDMETDADKHGEIMKKLRLTSLATSELIESRYLQAVGKLAPASQARCEEIDALPLSDFELESFDKILARKAREIIEQRDDDIVSEPAQEQFDAEAANDPVDSMGRPIFTIVATDAGKAEAASQEPEAPIVEAAVLPTMPSAVIDAKRAFTRQEILAMAQDEDPLEDDGEHLIQ